MKQIKKSVARLVVLAFMLSLFAVAPLAGAAASDVGVGDYQVFDVDSADSGFGGYIDGSAIIKMNDNTYSYADIAKAENGKYRFNSTSFASGTLYDSKGASVAKSKKSVIYGAFTTPVDTSVSGSSQKYTVRYPINIGAYGGTVCFCFRGGASSASTAVTDGIGINYAGAILNDSTWLTQKDYLKLNTDYIVDCVIDNSGDTTKYSLYVDGTLIGTKDYTTKYTYITQIGMRFPISNGDGAIAALDYTLGDINVFTGNIYESVTISASANQILLPEAGKTVKLQITADTAVELAKAYTGVFLSADGTLTVDGSAANDSNIAADGKITVIAKHPAALKGGTELDIPVSTIYHDIDNTPDSKYPVKYGTADTWYLVDKATNIAVDPDGNKFMQSAYAVATDGTQEDSHAKYTYKSYVLPTGLSGKVVLDMDYRVPFGFHPKLDAEGNPTDMGGSGQIRFYTGSSVNLLNIGHRESSSEQGVYFYTFEDVIAKTKGSATPEYVEGEPHRTTGAWQKLTFVFDYDSNTYSILLNGNVITANQPYDISTIASLRITGQWDNLRVYNAPHTAPAAYNLTVIDAAEDKTAHGTYSYYSIPGYAEECSILKWYIADSENSESWTFVGDGADYNVKPEDVGRYLKFVVQPASGESLTGVEFSSTPVRVTDAQIDVYSPMLSVNGEASGKLTAAEVNTVTYSVTITNYTESDKEIMLLAGMYDADVLLNPDIDEATLASGETKTFTVEVSAEYTVENINSAKMRVFLWTGDLTPVEIPFELPVVTK